MDLTDTRYEVENGLAWITIDRPDRMNAFRARTVDELIHLFTRAWASSDVGVICLTGAGDRAFCAGGDQKQRAETGDYGPSESGLFEIERLHRLIRDVPKPVIAAVNGVAIGGGHVLHVVCDVTIAADTATFGQVGPRVGSFDGGFGTAYLARVVGEKRAREIWFRCRRYDAATGERWGLVNQVVPPDRLRDEVRVWANDMLALSPTALRFLKQSFNADTEHIAGIAGLSFSGLGLFYGTEESREGVRAFTEDRPRTIRGIALRRRASRGSVERPRRGAQEPAARSTESSSPGKRRSSSSRRSEFSRVVPSSRCLITPASRSTLKWCVHVDLVTGRSKLPHGR